jgi:hypothetical protein
VLPRLPQLTSLCLTSLLLSHNRFENPLKKLKPLSNGWLNEQEFFRLADSGGAGGGRVLSEDSAADGAEAVEQAAAASRPLLRELVLNHDACDGFPPGWSSVSVPLSFLSLTQGRLSLLSLERLSIDGGGGGGAVRGVGMWKEEKWVRAFCDATHNLTHLRFVKLSRVGVQIQEHLLSSNDEPQSMPTAAGPAAAAPTIHELVLSQCFNPDALLNAFNLSALKRLQLDRVRCCRTLDDEGRFCTRLATLPALTSLTLLELRPSRTLGRKMTDTLMDHPNSSVRELVISDVQ